MGLGPGMMNLMLFGWEKTPEVGLFIKEVSKAVQELQMLLNILSLIAETMDIFNFSLGLDKNVYFVSWMHTMLEVSMPFVISS